MTSRDGASLLGEVPMYSEFYTRRRVPQKTPQRVARAGRMPGKLPPELPPDCWLQAVTGWYDDSAW